MQNKTSVYIGIFLTILALYGLVFYYRVHPRREDWEEFGAEQGPATDMSAYQINLAIIRAFKRAGMHRNPSTAELDKYQDHVTSSPELRRLDREALTQHLSAQIRADYNITTPNGPPSLSTPQASKDTPTSTATSAHSPRPTPEPPVELTEPPVPFKDAGIGLIKKEAILGIRKMLDSWIETYL